MLYYVMHFHNVSYYFPVLLNTKSKILIGSTCYICFFCSKSCFEYFGPEIKVNITQSWHRDSEDVFDVAIGGLLVQ